jgi:hypothetical protein
MFYLSAGFRTLPAILICIALIGCGAPPGVAPSASSPGPSGGSVRVDSATPPAGQPREFTFSGAVTGTNQVSRQACESSGKTYRHFTLTTDGNVAGRNYF